MTRSTRPPEKDTTGKIGPPNKDRAIRYAMKLLLQGKTKIGDWIVTTVPGGMYIHSRDGKYGVRMSQFKYDKLTTGNGRGE